MIREIAAAYAIRLVQASRPMLSIFKAGFTASHSQEVIMKKKKIFTAKTELFHFTFSWPWVVFPSTSYFGPKMAFVHKLLCAYSSQINSMFGMHTLSNVWSTAM